MNDAQLDDGSLLQQFAQTGSEEPFNELIARHGALVYGVSHRVLGQTQDAEDATQAVFLTLAEKAHALRGYRSVAGWLHHTAWNIARCARKAALCRKNREKEAASMISTGSTAQPRAEWEHLSPVLDQELNALPEKYRVALMLHHVEGRTQTEIARLLGVTGGALSRRISRAEELLRERLARRGVTFAPALLFPLILHCAPVPLPSGLAATTAHAIALTRAGASPFSPQVTALHKGALQSMFIKKVMIAASILLAALFVGGGAHAMFNGRSNSATLPSTGMAQNKKLPAAASPAGPHERTGGNEGPTPADALPASGQSDAEIAAWIAQLGSESPEERIAAMKNLRKTGVKAQAALKVAAEKGTGEAKARSATLLGVQTTAEALKKIAEAFAKIKSFEVDMDTMKLAGGIRVDGKGHIQAIPGSRLYKMDATAELQGLKLTVRAVCDGTTAWNEMGAPMGTQIMKAKATASAIEGMSLDLNAFTESYDLVSSRQESVQGKPTLIFTGMLRDDIKNGEDPYADGYQAVRNITAYVDGNSLLLNKYELADDKGVVTTGSTFSNLKLDGELDAKAFAYVPPAGVEVWDTDNPAPAKSAPESVAEAAKSVEKTEGKPSMTKAPGAPVEATDTAALLEKIGAANKAIANFETDEEHVMTMMGMSITTKGHIRDIAATHRFIDEKTTQLRGMMSIPSRTVCDGTTIYQEQAFPETGTQLRKIVFKMDYKDHPKFEPSLDANSIKVKEGDAFDFTASREETVDGVKQYIFEGVKQEPKPGEKPSVIQQKGKQTYTIVVDATDLLLRSIEVKNDAGAVIETTKYSNVKHDGTIDESVFLYSPPAGVKVSDLNDLKNAATAPAPESGKEPAKRGDF